MKLSRILIVLFLVVAVFLVWRLFTGYTSSEQQLPPLHTEKADRGEVSRRVIAFGSLQPVQKVTVGSQVSGIIEDIFADFNSEVRKDEVLARIDPSTFEAAVSSAAAELESAEAGLELARMQHQRVAELRERQFISPSEVDQANATLRQAEAQVRVRRHDLERAQRELDRTIIKAPTDGMVITREVDIGQTVAASLNAPILFELAANLSKMWIHANVAEADIGRVGEGQRVQFRVDAYPERQFEGEVIQVRNAPIIADNVVHYETIIGVDNSERLLKPGMTSEVSVITDQRDDVIRIRNTALRARLPDHLRPPEPTEAEGMDGLVYVVTESGLEARRVQTGLSDGVHTEILRGLEPGETVAVGLSLTSQSSSETRSLFSGSQAQY
ncbi:MAG TPA: efflux RND transporter periplasmic adaptor subunit [Balneolaceae bacterium]|nr:efflux RND transporter periplasmic adaptor subunit [Balneolaceae bacterium]